MRAIFDKKGKKKEKKVKKGKEKSRIFENLGKNAQNSKICLKRASDCVR